MLIMLNIPQSTGGMCWVILRRPPEYWLPAFTAYGMAVSDTKLIPLPLLLSIAAATRRVCRSDGCGFLLDKTGSFNLYLPISVSAQQLVFAVILPR